MLSPSAVAEIRVGREVGSMKKSIPFEIGIDEKCSWEPDDDASVASSFNSFCCQEQPELTQAFSFSIPNQLCYLYQ